MGKVFKARDERLDPESPSRRNPKIPPPLDEFVVKLLARSRDQRWPDARSAAEALRRVQ